jgi:hypothetical protein
VTQEMALRTYVGIEAIMKKEIHISKFIKEDYEGHPHS